MVSITHLGTYACRPMRSGSFLSEHAYANAIDVAAFHLADGRAVRVDGGWQAGDAREAFLKAVAKAACSEFSTVLTPAYDAAHYNHLHLDDGAWHTCGI